MWLLTFSSPKIWQLLHLWGGFIFPSKKPHCTLCKTGFFDITTTTLNFSPKKKRIKLINYFLQKNSA
jgi:hypothetical protein